MESQKKNSGLMEKLKSLETTTKNFFLLKQELEITMKSESESKIQLLFYSKKTAEFEGTILKTEDMLTKFKAEVEKVMFFFFKLLFRNSNKF